MQRELCRTREYAERIIKMLFSRAKDERKAIHEHEEVEGDGHG